MRSTFGGTRRRGTGFRVLITSRKLAFSSSSPPPLASLALGVFLSWNIDCSGLLLSRGSMSRKGSRFLGALFNLTSCSGFSAFASGCFTFGLLCLFCFCCSGCSGGWFCVWGGVSPCSWRSSRGGMYPSISRMPGGKLRLFSYICITSRCCFSCCCRCSSFLSCL